MFKNISLFTLFLCVSIATAQDDKLDKAYQRMADDTCKCINESDEDFSNMASTEVEMKFGLCMLRSYSKDKEYYATQGVVITGADSSMESIAEQIGVKMALTCPDVIMMVANTYEDEEEETGQENNPSITGQIMKVESGTFSLVHVKGDDGRLYKMLWMTYIDNNELMQAAIDGKEKYQFTYYESDLYDNRISEYRTMLIMDGIEKLN